MRAWVVLLVAVAAAGNSAPLRAQESRAATIAQQQARKARDTRPPVPSSAEGIVSRLRQSSFEEPGGFFPYFGSVYGGGGFTLGAGYRRLYGDSARWAVTGLYSLKRYKLITLGTVLPGHLDGRMSLRVEAGWRDATQVGFYGLGMDTSLDDRTNFRLQQAFAQGDAIVRPIGAIVLAGGVSIEDFSREPGQGPFPSIETTYSPEDVPGLTANPRFLHSYGAAGIDTRASPEYARRGSYYGVVVHDYADWDGTFGFERFDAEAVQHIPVLRETWVVSLRGRAQTTLDDDSVVPFFLLPSLGSGRTLRGYSSWRFRDRHSLLMSAEWRWIPNRLAFDMALFVDAGKVTSTRDTLDFHGLESDWGVGARLHTARATPLRIELAHGSEGWNLIFSGNAPF